MAYIYDLSDTWNAAGTTFFGIKMNVTNSASASGSKLLSLQVAGTEYFGVDKDGNVTIGNGGDLNISSATGGDASKIYNDAEDLYFQTNGSTRLLINSSGNIGIGNTSPGAKLDVTGNIRLSASSPNIELNNGGPMIYSTASNTLMFATGGGPSSPVERMRITSGGDLGLGTTSLNARLTIAGGISVNAAIYNASVDAAQMDYDGTGSRFFAYKSTGSYHTFWTNASGGSVTERMRIDSSGNVGIGTASPGYKLQVNGTMAGVVSSGANYSAIRTSDFYYMNVQADGIDTYTSGNSSAPMLFKTGGTERMRIDSSGNIGIGTSSPGFKLDIASGDIRLSNTNGIRWGTSDQAFIFGDDGDGGGYLRFGINSERMRIDSTGNVGIGTTGPSGKLDVRGATGTTAIINSYNDSTTGNVYSYFSNLQNTGNSTSSYHYAGVTQGVNIWYLYGNGTSSWSSDQRLKKNIESTRDGYLDDLCQLRVVKYNWHTDADDKPRELGLIAQEVEAVFPGLVEEALQDIDDTGIRYKVLKGSVLPYMLLKALQEANAKIEALTARVAQLEGN